MLPHLKSAVSLNVFWVADMVDVDFLTLERAFHEVAGNAMKASLAEVVQFAADNWGYPGTCAAARYRLVQSGRYEVDDGMVVALDDSLVPQSARVQ